MRRWSWITYDVFPRKDESFGGHDKIGPHLEDQVPKAPIWGRKYPVGILKPNS